MDIDNRLLKAWGRGGGGLERVNGGKKGCIILSTIKIELPNEIKSLV